MSKHATLEAVVEMTDSIPCAPHILPKLQHSLLGTYVTTQELQSIIELDPGLATSVLRMANSAYFGRDQKCESIANAILLLGTAALSRLTVTSQAGNWLNQPIKGYGWEPGDLCRHSLCVAVASEILSTATGLADPNVAYTAGLIYDVGKLALAYANSEGLAEVIKLVPSPYPTWEEAENAVLGYCSTDVSRLLLQRWSLPHALIEVATGYLHPSRVAPQNFALVTTVHAAKSIATELGYGIGVDGYYFEVDEAALAEMNFTEESLQACVPAIVERMDALITPEGIIKALS
ncbi:MAG: HDOD domain-containing protein [Verrucomicrobiae bacterium]